MNKFNLKNSFHKTALKKNVFSQLPKFIIAFYLHFKDKM